jgi:hypothetical protein
MDDAASLTVMELRAKARRFKSQHDVQLVVVDYLQLMRAGVRTDSREQEISEISRSLKALAKELGIPVMALSQLNRGATHLIRQGGQLEAVAQDGAALLERRSNHPRHQIGPRREDQEQLGGGRESVPRREGERPGRLREGRAARLAHRQHVASVGPQPLGEPGHQGGLPGPFRSFHHDESAPGRRGHPRVMIGLAAPFLIPSAIC